MPSNWVSLSFISSKDSSSIPEIGERTVIAKARATDPFDWLENFEEHSSPVG